MSLKHFYHPQSMPVRTFFFSTRKRFCFSAFSRRFRCLLKVISEEAHFVLFKMDKKNLLSRIPLKVRLWECKSFFLCSQYAITEPVSHSSESGSPCHVQKFPQYTAFENWEKVKCLFGKTTTRFCCTFKFYRIICYLVTTLR